MLVIDLHPVGGSTGIAIPERTRLDDDTVAAIVDLVDRLGAVGIPVDITCDARVRRRLAREDSIER